MSNDNYILLKANKSKVMHEQIYGYSEYPTICDNCNKVISGK